MSWEAVFGESWFWIAAGLIWARAALSFYGAPRKLINEARRGTMEGRIDGVAPAAFAYDLVRWRLGPGNPLPRGLLPLRWPLLGGAAAWCVANAVFGDAASLAALTALGPVAAATLALEPRLQAAVDAARAAAAAAAPSPAGEGASVVDAASGGMPQFADTLEQLWRVRMASVALAVLATAVAAIVTRGLL